MKDLSNNPAIAYGKEKEDEAFVDLCNEFGKQRLPKVGYFVSKVHNWVGASPDGILDDDTIIEIKCPFILSNIKPSTEFNLKLTNQQKNSFCSKMDECGNFNLRENHKYWWQVQTQMYVLEFRKAKFVI